MSAHDRPDPPPRRNFYGRRGGKNLRPSQKVYLAEDLAELRLPGISPADNPDRAPFDPESRFGSRPVWLEIGFGGGEHMVHQAARNPDVGFIGCEPYINGVAMLLGKVRQAGMQNLAIHPGDVRELFDVLPAASVQRCFLLYPDPWPKRRHHRRRFVTPGYVDPLTRVLAPGAILRVASDIPDYIRQALEEIGTRPEYEWLARRPADWREPWDDWISTRYERKALREGRKPHYLTFRRR